MVAMESTGTRTSRWKYFQRVAAREWRRILQNPIYLIGSAGVLAFCSFFFLTFFEQGMPEDLPIGVVDLDRSFMSREFARNLDATQLGKVIHYDSFSEAREDMMKGNLTAICVIPEHLYTDALSSRQPVVTYYLNSLYFVGGALAYKDLLTMVNLTNGSVKRQVLQARGLNEDAIMGLIRPIQVDTHQIGNAYTNYGYYLINILLPAILEMIVIIIVIYALGTELKYSTSRTLLRHSGGSVVTAVTGKLFVYTLLFILLGIVLELLLYSWMHFPIKGSILNMILNVILLVLASESVAIFIFGCLPVTRLAMSIGALYSVLGFSLSGFTLPIEAMPAAIQGWAAAFPIRHYYLFYTQEVIFGSGWPGWWTQVVAMLLFTLLPFTVIKRI